MQPPSNKVRFNARGCLTRICTACSVLLVSVAMAQPAADGLGRQIATNGVPDAVPACSGCHGTNGEGSAAFPYLRGIGEGYLLAQLNAFATGARKNAVMQPIAHALTDKQRSAVSSYFGALASTATKIVSAQPADPSRHGEWLARRGRWKDDLPACAQCHGVNGAGVGTQIPPLAGLPQAYITGQLQAWKSGSRPPGPLSLMEGVAAKLSEADILAVSAYYAQAGASSTTSSDTAKGGAAK